VALDFCLTPHVFYYTFTIFGIMARTYNIKDVEALTNIKAHTIRIWEQRYNIAAPDRTEGNSRRYSEEELKKLMNIAFLNRNGIKISFLASMTDSQINEKVKQLYLKKRENDDFVNNMIESLITQDDKEFAQLFDQSVLQFGFEGCFNKVIKPLFYQIGILWQTGTIDATQEHFISNFVRQKLLAATDSLPEGDKKRTFLLFLPDNEMHELGLLFYQYILKKRGFNVVYLGQSVPVEEVKRYEQIRKFDFIITSKTNFYSDEDLQLLVDGVCTHFQSKIILFTGSQFIDKAMKFPPNARYFKDSEELLNITQHLQ
jgi:MerR family transcriptional regulator, light-induced transcriptional regulator